MSASAVHPLHSVEQQVPGIRCWAPIAILEQWVQAWPLPLGDQAGGLATQSVNVLFTRCFRQSNGSPVRLP